MSRNDCEASNWRGYTTVATLVQGGTNLPAILAKSDETLMILAEVESNNEGKKAFETMKGP